MLRRLLGYQKVLAANIDIILHWIFVDVLDSLALNSLCRPDAASASSVLRIKTSTAVPHIYSVLCKSSHSLRARTFSET